MSSFTRDELDRLGRLWRRMLEHRFLREAREGTIADEAFVGWLRQDYLFVEASVGFVAGLLARAPRRHYDLLGDAIAALRGELRFFEREAAAVGSDLAGVAPAFTTSAYVHFLRATAASTYEEGLTVLYAAEKAYLDSWSGVRAGIDPGSRWFPFVENWTAPGFERYVAALGTALDETASEASPAQRERMSAAFELTALYELAFWGIPFGDELRALP